MSNTIKEITEYLNKTNLLGILKDDTLLKLYLNTFIGLDFVMIKDLYDVRKYLSVEQLKDKYIIKIYETLKEYEAKQKILNIINIIGTF